MKKIILWLLTPVQKFLQRTGNQESLINKNQVDNLLSLIKEGDILLSYENGRPTSFLIKGYYDHAAIVSSKMSVVEAVGDKFVDGKNIGGVREVDLEEWLYKKDSVAVVRPLYPSIYTNKLAASNSLSHIGKSYDYTFSLSEEKLYCSELVYICYRVEDADFLKHIEGEILPHDYYELTQMSLEFDLIAEVKNEKN